MNKNYETKSNVNVFLTYIIIGNLRPLPRPLTQEKIFQGAVMKVRNVDMFTCANNSLLFLRDVHDDFYSLFPYQICVKYSIRIHISVHVCVLKKHLSHY